MARKRLSLCCSTTAAAALLIAAPPALAGSKKEAAAPEAVPSHLAGFTQGAAVQSYYKHYRGPQWFADGGEAVAELAKVLRRSQLDGLPQGPSLAEQVERAALSAGTKSKSERAVAEQLLSAAWVTYVEAIERPSNDVIFGYPTLVARPSTPHAILTAAGSAPSLAQHLAKVSEVNPFYSKLRETAWAQAGSNPVAVPDPRVVLNLSRLRSLPRTERYALVNIATQTLTMFENDKPVDSMKVIVGADDLPTPMISSVIYYATFNPYWNVPAHLVRKTTAPAVLKQGKSYLTVRGYQVMSGWSSDATVVPPDNVDWAAVAAGRTTVRVRQNPSAYNSMGKLKFSFENGEGIFMHDTPSKALFSKAERTLSNGCVRLEDARRFGRWLLQREPVAPSSTPEQFVPLPTGVPVYITYLTAQENNGKIAYLKDVYGWDAGGRFKPLGASASAAR